MRWILCLATSYLAAGCASNGPEVDKSVLYPPEQTGAAVSVDVGSDLYSSSERPRLSVRVGDEVISAELGIGVFIEGTDIVWSLHVPNVDVDELRNGRIRSTIRLSEGGVNIRDGVRTLVAEAVSGAIALDIADGRITGTVTAEPTTLSAVVDGELSFSCLIPRTGGGAGLVSDDDVPVVSYVEDTELTSPLCGELAAVLR